MIDPSSTAAVGSFLASCWDSKLVLGGVGVPSTSVPTTGSDGTTVLDVRLERERRESQLLLEAGVMVACSTALIASLSSSFTRSASLSLDSAPGTSKNWDRTLELDLSDEGWDSSTASGIASSTTETGRVDGWDGRSLGPVPEVRLNQEVRRERGGRTGSRGAGVVTRERGVAVAVGAVVSDDGAGGTGLRYVTDDVVVPGAVVERTRDGDVGAEMEVGVSPDSAGDIAGGVSVTVTPPLQFPVPNQDDLLPNSAPDDPSSFWRLTACETPMSGALGLTALTSTAGPFGGVVAGEGATRTGSMSISTSSLLEPLMVALLATLAVLDLPCPFPLNVTVLLRLLMLPLSSSMTDFCRARWMAAELERVETVRSRGAGVV